MTSEEKGRQRYLARLMRGSLNSFKAGDLPLKDLVSDISSLIDSLEEVAPSDWIAELRGLWWELELSHSLALDEGRDKLTAEEQDAVNNSVEALTNMLLEYSDSDTG